MKGGRTGLIKRDGRCGPHPPGVQGEGRRSYLEQPPQQRCGGRVPGCLALLPTHAV